MSEQEREGPRTWTVEGSEAGPDLKVFRVRRDQLRNPRNGIVSRITVLETPDWVNVVPVTDEGHIVLVEQWRFGPRQLTWEIPGGVVDPGEGHREAAERELREETGCTASEWSYLGASQPNPAFHDNHCHHYLARGARRVGDLQPDPGEDLRVLERPVAHLPELIASGRIQHSLVLAALCRVLDLSSASPRI